MSSFERNYGQAQYLAERAHHYSYGDGADAATGQSMATEGLVFAVLALIDTLREPAPVEFAVAPSCPCGCSGGPDQCTCGMRCVCSDCVYCDAILRGVAIPGENDGDEACDEAAALAEAQEDADEQTFVGRYLVPADRADEAKYAAAMATTVDEAPAFHDSDTCPACVNKRNYGHSGFGVIPNLMSIAPLPEPHGDRMAATAKPVPVPDFNCGDLVSVSDPTHRHYGRHGRIVGYVYDPPGYAVEYDTLGSTLILAPDQLRCEVSAERIARFEADEAHQTDAELAAMTGAAVPIPTPRDGEQAVARAPHYGGQPCPGCPDCTGYPDLSEPDDEDGDESRFTRAQLDGDACTVCGTWLADGEATVSSAYDPGAGQLFAHLRCVPDDEPTADPCAICGDCIASGEDFVTRGPDDRPEYAHANCAEAVAADELTNCDVDPECDAAEDAYGDTPMYDGSEG